MPTEFLHGLYDGGIGAGLRDYWDVMGNSPTVGGGFFWVFADEGIERTDRERPHRQHGQLGPDGIVGPHGEKEGSYYSVKEIWSPVELHYLKFSDGLLKMHVENRYDFTNLERCSLTWRALRLPFAPSRSAPVVLAEGRVPMPPLPASEGKAWEVPVGVQTLAQDEILEVAVRDPQDQELWKWVVRGAPRPRAAIDKAPRVEQRSQSVSGGAYSLEFDPATGMLARLTVRGRAIPLSGPHLAAWRRAPKLRSFVNIAGESSLRKLELAPGDGTLARAEYDGALREVSWKLEGDELVVRYRIAFEGAADILGVSFDYPEKSVLAKRWVGAGPYRIWKNRQVGTEFGLHQANYSRSTPGVTYEYPEFEEFFGNGPGSSSGRARPTWSTAMAARFRSSALSATPGEKPVLELPKLGWTFLHGVPPIGTKFALADVLGPQSQSTTFTGSIEGEARFAVSRDHRGADEGFRSEARSIRRRVLASICPSNTIPAGQLGSERPGS